MTCPKTFFTEQEVIELMELRGKTLLRHYEGDGRGDFEIHKESPLHPDCPCRVQALTDLLNWIAFIIDKEYPSHVCDPKGTAIGRVFDGWCLTPLRKKWKQTPYMAFRCISHFVGRSYDEWLDWQEKYMWGN